MGLPAFSVCWSLWTTVVLLLSFRGGNCQFCEAKSWASIAASEPKLQTSSTQHDPSTKPTRHTEEKKNIPSSPVANAAGVHAKLPPGATKYRVRNVYDGDTLTLIDERRVRFLGIDTPEVAEKQPFALEAKQYTRKYCHKKDVYIAFEPGQAQTDHYGRLLAFVWVELDGGQGYLNVNEGIVAAGLATVYLPNKDAKLGNLKHMIRLQKQARADRLGIWSNFRDYNVLVTPRGAAFHVAGCKHLSKSRHRNFKTLKASAAVDMGLHPCRTCLADA